VKELTGMPVSADLLLLHLYFKSFNSCPYFLSSTSLSLQIFADEKAALEAHHQDCTPSVDVAKQLDDRDAAHKAEVEQLKGRIAELLDEKEQSEGQLKKAQELLVTSEADASSTHTELDGLKEQATKWEVAIAQLNADLASKLQILLPILPDISLAPTHLFRHNLYADKYFPA
jgi:hypothetical protein